MAYRWTTTPKATFRLPATVDANGDFAPAAGSTGTTNVNFGYITNNATLPVILNGDSTMNYRGLGGVFIEFLLGANYDAAGARKTVVYDAEEVA